MKKNKLKVVVVVLAVVGSFVAGWYFSDALTSAAKTTTKKAITKTVDGLNSML